jgi:RimJ/RimL family protein N-acetyltransferase
MNKPLWPKSKNGQSNNMPPILETERLYLRPPTTDDLEGIYRLGSNPNVMRFITGKTQSRKEARKDLARRMETAHLPLGYWIVETRQAKDFVGWLALKQLDKTPEIEIGYRFLEEQWGRGFATEASQEVLAYGFDTLQLERIVAVAMVENKASLRVMEKIGLRFEKTARFYHTDCVYYAIMRSDYENLKRESTL